MENLNQAVIIFPSSASLSPCVPTTERLEEGDVFITIKNQLPSACAIVVTN